MLEERLSNEAVKNDQLTTQQLEHSTKTTQTIKDLEETNSTLQNELTSVKENLSTINTDLGNSQRKIEEVS